MNSRPLSVATLILSALSCSAPSHKPPERPQLAPSGECTAREISRTPLRVEGGRELYVEPTALVPSGNETLLAGWPTYLWVRSAEGRVTGAVQDSVFGAVIGQDGSARIVPSPINGRPFRGVRAIAASEGGWDVVFAEAQADFRIGEKVVVQALWYGRYDGRRWKALERLPLLSEGTLSVSNPSSLVSTGDGLAWAVALERTTRSDGVALFERKAGRWSVEVFGTGGTSYLEVLHAESNDLTVAVVQGDHTQQPSENVLILYGRRPAWGILRRLTRGVDGPVHHVVGIPSDKGWRLSWYVNLPPGARWRREARTLFLPVGGLPEAAVAIDADVEHVRATRVAGLEVLATHHLAADGGKGELRIFGLGAGGARTLMAAPYPFRGFFAMTSPRHGELLIAGPRLEPGDETLDIILLRAAVRCT